MICKMKLINVRLTKFAKILSSKGFSAKAESPEVLQGDGDTQLAVSEIFDCATNECYKQPKVVIIGAGVAGLAAAHRLVQCGINNFTVIEAKERPGGRIHSCWLGDAAVDLGSQRKADTNKTASALYSLAVQDELAGPRSAHTRELFCRPLGGDPDLPITISAYQKFHQIQREAASLIRLSGPKKHGSLLNFIGTRIQQELRGFPDEQQYDAARVMFGMTSVLRSKCSDDMTLLTCDLHASFVEVPGGEVRVPLGAVGAIAPLLRIIPDGLIRYCKPVAVVHWGTAQKTGYRALVRCCDGDEFPADYVIVTVSAGVLRRSADVMFCPALPANKVEAFTNIGWEMCNMVFLDYCRPFWFWNTGDLRLSFKPNELRDRRDWTRGVVSVAPVRGSDHVLSARVVGPEAVELEDLSDGDVSEALTILLRERTGNGSLPYPSGVLRSHWTSDRHFCGGFSVTPCGTKPAWRGATWYGRELAVPVPGPGAPVPPVLLFAGEATSPAELAGTVEGAQLSGVREAERVLHLTTVMRGPPLPPAPSALIVAPKPTEEET